MDSNIGFVVKVVVASAILSASIKYGGPLLEIPPKSAIAAIVVCAPSVILFSILCWRGYLQSQSPSKLGER